MSHLNAERMFNQGLALLTDGRPMEAADRFLKAMRIEQQLSVRRPDMRYLSYYGLSLARAQHSRHAALEACELAAQRDPSNALVWLNLGRVRKMAGRLPEALQCFERGLKVAPGHRSLQRELSLVDRRKRPVIPFLPRSNVLNRLLGRLRYSLRTGPSRSPHRPRARPS